MSKRFYWMKLKENFMTSDTVDFLMSQPNGAEYVVLYQMLCLQTLNTDGVLGRTIGEVMIPYDAAKIQRDCKYFSIDTVTLALEYYKKLGLVFEQDNGFLKIANYENIIGSESGVRGGSNEGLSSTQAKSNAERQRAFRAKITCGQHQHVPSIDQHMNNKRYGGNYYIVMRRDNFKCTMCGSIENLCVHHIDGYNGTKPENNAENKMLVLCRECHSQVHAGRQIPSNILEEIGYEVTQKRNVTDGCNVTSNVTVTTEIEMRDRDINTHSIRASGHAPVCAHVDGVIGFEPPTLEEVKAFVEGRQLEHVDAERFYNWFSASGWYRGRTRIIDWQAEALNWERRGIEDVKRQTAPTRGRDKPSSSKNFDERTYADGVIAGVSIDDLEDDDL